MSSSNTASQEAEDRGKQRRRAQNVRRLTAHFRILIIGRANAGKTTILQRVCNTTEQPKIFNQKGQEIDLSKLNSTAKRGEHDIEDEMIFESNMTFVFHDSCGFEAGSKSELDKVKNFVQKCSMKKNLGDNLHAIWYCISMEDRNRPITSAELNFFNECGTGRVPVIVVFTKADRLDAQTTKSLMKTGMDFEAASIKAPEQSVAMFHEKFGQQLYKNRYPPKEHVYFRDMQNSTSDCSELLRKTAATLSDDTILQLFLTVQKSNVSLSIEYAIIRVIFPEWKLFKRRKEWREMVENIFCYFPHMKNFNYDHAFGRFLQIDFGGGNNDINEKLIPVEDVLNFTNWPFMGDTKTFEDIAFLCIATAVIAEHSFFLWKQKPSASTAPIKLAIEKLNSSDELKKIKAAIKEVSHSKTKDQKLAVVKIALENCLSL